MMNQQKELNKQLKYWQKRLRLQDWRIKVKLSQSAEMTDLANLTPWREEKEALIRIDKRGHPTGIAGGKYDNEMLLLHELLEIYWGHITIDTNHTEKETAINMIVEALIEEHRNK